MCLDASPPCFSKRPPKATTLLRTQALPGRSVLHDTELAWVAQDHVSAASVHVMPSGDVLFFEYQWIGCPAEARSVREGYSDPRLTVCLLTLRIRVKYSWNNLFKKSCQV